MAVLLVATFPILLLINSEMAWLGVSVGSLLLYLDSRREARAHALRSSVPGRTTATPRTRTPHSRKRADSPRRASTDTLGLPSRA